MDVSFAACALLIFCIHETAKTFSLFYCTQVERVAYSHYAACIEVVMFLVSLVILLRDLFGRCVFDGAALGDSL